MPKLSPGAWQVEKLCVFGGLWGRGEDFFTAMDASYAKVEETNDSCVPTLCVHCVH